MSRVLESFPYILGGAGVTIVVILVALPVGFCMGLALAFARTHGTPFVSHLATLYGLAMRGVPPVALLFLIYFVITGSINVSPFVAGTIGLAIISSSYQMEVFRGGIKAVGPGQEIAARAIGLTRTQAILHIVLPQALRLSLPAWSSIVASLIKESALVYVLGVQELLRRASLVAARTYSPLVAYGFAAVIYLLMTLLVTRSLAALEKRTRIPTLAER